MLSWVNHSAEWHSDNSDSAVVTYWVFLFQLKDVLSLEHQHQCPPHIPAWSHVAFFSTNILFEDVSCWATYALLKWRPPAIHLPWKQLCLVMFSGNVTLLFHGVVNMQFKTRPQESFGVVGLCIWMSFEAGKPVHAPCTFADDIVILLILGGNNQTAAFCYGSAMCQGWTLNPPSCLARLVRSNSPHAWWSCPRGRMWAKRCGRKSIELLGCPPRTTELVLLLLWGRTIYFGRFVLCSASLHNCIWKCSRCFVVQQVWSSEKFNFQ